MFQHPTRLQQTPRYFASSAKGKIKVLAALYSGKDKIYKRMYWHWACNQVELFVKHAGGTSPRLSLTAVLGKTRKFP